jgi:hypothetical protein
MFNLYSYERLKHGESKVREGNEKAMLLRAKRVKQRDSMVGKYRERIDNFINELEWSPVDLKDGYQKSKRDADLHHKKMKGRPNFRHHQFLTEAERVKRAAEQNSLLMTEPGDYSYKLRRDEPSKELIHSVRYKPKGDMERLFDTLDRSVAPNENELVDESF